MTSSKDINIAINAPAVTPAQPSTPTNPPAETTTVPAPVTAPGPTGMFLGVENTTWAGIIGGIGILSLAGFAYWKGYFKKLMVKK